MQKTPKIGQAESDLEAAQTRLHEIEVASARVAGRYKAIGALSIDVNHLSSGRQL